MTTSENNELNHYGFAVMGGSGARLIEYTGKQAHKKATRICAELNAGPGVLVDSALGIPGTTYKVVELFYRELEDERGRDTAGVG